VLQVVRYDLLEGIQGSGAPAPDVLLADCVVTIALISEVLTARHVRPMHAERWPRSAVRDA